MKILFHNECLKHNSENHIEGRYRIEEFKNKFKNTGSIQKGEEYLKTIYSKKYIDEIKKASFQKMYFAEVNTTPSTYKSACISVDLAVRASIQGDFAITRPPGHHAGKDKGEGFCFFNNIAIATQRLIDRKQRVCILDIDGHYGNGTADIFKNNTDVLYCSLHQENVYPNRGFIDDLDQPSFPLCPNSGDDVFLEVVNLFKILIQNFNPNFIAISAGFDGYFKDSLLNLNFTKKGYWNLGKLINEEKKKVFCCLEGGYHNEILSCTRELINGLQNNDYTDREKLSKSDDFVKRDFEKKREIFCKLHNISL